MATVGVCLLVATAFAGAASSASAAGAKSDARGGTFRLDSTSDFDYIDPQLAYFSHSWQLGDAVGLPLLGFPDKEGVAGTSPPPEAAAGLPPCPRTARRTRSDQDRVQVQQRRTGHRGQLRRVDQPVAATRRCSRPLPPSSRTSSARRLSSTARPRGRRASRPPVRTLTVKLDEGRSGLPLADDDGVLPGHPGEPADQADGIQRADGLGGPVLRQGVGQAPVGADRAQPALEQRQGAVEVARRARRTSTPI